MNQTNTSTIDVFGMEGNVEIEAGELSFDRSRYNELNDVIGGGLKTFVEVGLALAEVKRAKLYKIEFDTWDDYLKGKWGMERSYASRLIRTAPVARAIEKMLPNGNISDFQMPTSEAQIRPLTRLKTVEMQLEAWKGAHVDGSGKAPTMDEVEAAVVSLIGKPKPKQRKLPSAARDGKVNANPSPTVHNGNGSAESEISPSGRSINTECNPPSPSNPSCELADVTMVDGTTRQIALGEYDYIDTKLGPHLLDDVCKQVPCSADLKLQLQEVLLHLIADLNQRFINLTKETRNAIKQVWPHFADIIQHIPMLAAKPGDYVELS